MSIVNKNSEVIPFYNNSISLIRMYSAVVVLLWHTIAHLELIVPGWLNELVSWVSPVPIFMSISGYLIWRSIDNSSSYTNYICKRIIRIYPELWASVILGTVVMLILYGTGNNIKKLVLFLFCQATLLQFWTPESLRGYGYGSPNVALSTISIVFQFYIIAWIIKKRMEDKSFFKWLICWLFLIIICMKNSII